MNVPVVVSASWQPQKVNELSAPVSVITADDVKRSGLIGQAAWLPFMLSMSARTTRGLARRTNGGRR